MVFERTGDFRVEVAQTAPLVVRFEFFDTGEAGQQRGVLTVQLTSTSMGPKARSVSYESLGDHEIGAELNRISWKRWITAAETIASAPHTDGFFLPGGDNPIERIESWRDNLAAHRADVQAAVGHPGRRGHGDDHYQRVAELYRTLVAAGNRQPVKTIAEQLGVKPNTVSSWVREARARDLLPAGQRGKAG